MAPDDGTAARADAVTSQIVTEPASLSRIVVAEALGSGFLAFTVVASGILAERYAIHNIALAQLMTAIAGAGAFLVLARALGAIAPSYFNPAFAFALTLTRRLSIQTGLICAAAQFLAASLGVMMAHIVTNTGLVQVATQIQTGEGVWLGELLAVAIFIFALLSIGGRWKDSLPLTGAVCLLAFALATPSISFANPALTLARTLTDSFTAIRLSDAMIIVAVQMLAAFCAWGLHAWLFPPTKQP